MLVAAVDPNWFAAATAQCGAALVAIVGAFLLSRVLAISSERGAVGHDLEQLDEESKHKAGLLHQAELWIAQEDSRDLVDEAWDSIMKNGVVPSASELLLEHEPTNARAELCIPVLENLLGRLSEACELVGNAVGVLFDGGASMPSSFDALVDASALDVKPEWASYAERYFDDREDAWYKRFEQRDRERRPKTAFASLYGGISPSLMRGLGPRFPQVQSLIPIIGGQKYNQIVRDRDALAAECEHIRRRTFAIQRRYQSLVIPADTWFGFGALVIFAASGVVLPLAVLMGHPEAASSTQDWLVMSGFASGLSLMVLYVAIALYRLRRRASEGPLPDAG